MAEALEITVTEVFRGVLRTTDGHGTCSRCTQNDRAERPDLRPGGTASIIHPDVIYSSTRSAQEEGAARNRTSEPEPAAEPEAG